MERKREEESVEGDLGDMSSHIKGSQSVLECGNLPGIEIISEIYFLVIIRRDTRSHSKHAFNIHQQERHTRVISRTGNHTARESTRSGAAKKLQVQSLFFLGTRCKVVVFFAYALSWSQEFSPQGGDSLRLGCGGGNINSAQRSNEEIAGTNWFSVF